MCLQYGNDTCNVSLILLDGSECFDICIHKYKTAFLQNHSLHRRNKNTWGWGITLWGCDFCFSLCCWTRTIGECAIVTILHGNRVNIKSWCTAADENRRGTSIFIKPVILLGLGWERTVNRQCWLSYPHYTVTVSSSLPLTIWLWWVLIQAKTERRRRVLVNRTAIHLHPSIQQGNASF